MERHVYFVMIIVQGKGTGKAKKASSLKKSYSQMTESERKELVKKAMKAKEKLEKELKETREQMEAKDKEINRLQNEVQ